MSVVLEFNPRVALANNRAMTRALDDGGLTLWQSDLVRAYLVGVMVGHFDEEEFAELLDKAVDHALSIRLTEATT